MSPTKKSLLVIIGLIMTTTAALAAMGTMGNTPVSEPQGDGSLSISTEVVQDKIIKESDGRVAVSLRLNAPRMPVLDKRPESGVDLVIVLDRSGSMEGQKLHDARQALIGLLDLLGQEDRLALVTYSNDVEFRSGLSSMNPTHRRQLRSTIKQIHAGGGTNLGRGLDGGMGMLMQSLDTDRQRKVILISDGLANQGVVDPVALGRKASAAMENRFSISTVGVGLDFNEVLMTAIADQGAGQYHFLEDPRVFARVFEEEFLSTRHVVAADVEIRIPLGPGVRLASAGGYPVRHEENTAVIHPGNLLSGQSRTLFLTFQVPTAEEGAVALGHVHVQYQQDGQRWAVDASRPLTVSCVKDSAEALGSIKKASWADQVLQEEFSSLKEAVAGDIRDGDRTRAQARIREYETKQKAMNTVVGSGRVAKNLETDVQDLRQRVNETFTGSPSAVAEKRKKAAKSLQYDGYKLRRDK